MTGLSGRITITRHQLPTAGEVAAAAGSGWAGSDPRQVVAEAAG
jgi:hypothetical protein